MPLNVLVFWLALGVSGTTLNRRITGARFYPITSR
jgi:hypothetical protein